MNTSNIPHQSPLLLFRAGWIEMVSGAIPFLFLCFWHWRVAGEFSWQIAAGLGVITLLYLAYGHIFCIAIERLFRNPVGLPFQLLGGYFLFNTLLFILALCSPLGMKMNLVLLACLGGAGCLAMRTRDAADHASRDVHGTQVASLLAILIGCIGATMWCGDVQSPIDAGNGEVMFKAWPDIFIHVREISVFAQAHGLSTIHDIKLAGGPAPLYHFASYLSPAAVSVMTGGSAMQAYASVHLPFGIFLTGLAAYCLFGTMFGAWPGVAALVAIVLLPDAYKQGFGNRYLSYNFLAQVNLGMLYGLTCMAMAWTFVLEGCRRGKALLIFLGYLFFGLCLFYKAHIFVANSYLMLIFPLLFYTRVRGVWRAVAGVVASAVFVSVITYSQTNPRVPVMRLDGSGIGAYLVVLINDYDPGILKAFSTRVLITEHHGKPFQALCAAGLILISTFGFWIALFPAALVAGYKRMPAAFRWWPVLVLVNYLVMSMGLAADSRSVGTSDELLNRPLVWAYFVIAGWTAAALYWRFIGASLPAGKTAFICASVVAAAGVSVLVYQAPDLQTFPTRKHMRSFKEFAMYPACLLRSADYLRTHSAEGQVIQDSTFDPRFVLTAISERQLYVGAVSFGGKDTEQFRRMGEVRKLVRIDNEPELQRFVASHPIDWYLVVPGSSVAWPAQIKEHPEFRCGGYQLYRLSRSPL